jgi:hypothetical protein
MHRYIRFAWKWISPHGMPIERVCYNLKHVQWVVEEETVTKVCKGQADSKTHNGKTVYSTSPLERGYNNIKRKVLKCINPMARHRKIIMMTWKLIKHCTGWCYLNLTLNIPYLCSVEDTLGRIGFDGVTRLFPSAFLRGLKFITEYFYSWTKFCKAKRLND